MTWAINELIGFSSCAMSQAHVSIVTKLQLPIYRENIKEKMIDKNVS